MLCRAGLALFRNRLNVTIPVAIDPVKRARTEHGDFDYVTVLDQTNDRLPDTLEVGLEALLQEPLLGNAPDGVFGLRLFSQILQNIYFRISTSEYRGQDHSCCRLHYRP